MVHAQQIGEWITTLGAYPSLGIGRLLDSHEHDTAAILKESLEAEAQALALYRELVQAVEGRSVALEEYARQMIQLRSCASTSGTAAWIAGHVIV